MGIINWNYFFSDNFWKYSMNRIWWNFNWAEFQWINRNFSFGVPSYSVLTVYPSLKNGSFRPLIGQDLNWRKSSIISVVHQSLKTAQIWLWRRLQSSSSKIKSLTYHINLWGRDREWRHSQVRAVFDLLYTTISF